MAKTERPAPAGQGTYAELDGGNTFTGEQVFESIQSDTITVGRTDITNVQSSSTAIAITEDDTYVVFGGSGPVWDYIGTAATVGYQGGVRQRASFRFTNLGIPQGATIVSAQLRTEVKTTTTDTVKWEVGLVDSLNAVTPVSLATFPEEEDLINPSTQATGTIAGATDGDIIYFPTVATEAVFVDALQSLVSNTSWGASSSVMIRLGDKESSDQNIATIWNYTLGGGERIPTLIITYTSLEYKAVATVEEVVIATPRIVLPDTLYSVVGDTLQLFHRGIAELPDPYAVAVEISSTIPDDSATKDYALPRYYQVTPLIADAGTADTLTVSVIGTDGDALATKVTPLIVTNPSVPVGAPLNVLCLGDSTTEDGLWPTELYRRVATAGGSPAGLGVDADIAFVGDRDMTAYTGLQAYTGIGGWGFPEYNGETSIVAYELTDVGHTQDNTITGTTWTASDGGTWYVEYVDAPNGKIKVHVDTSSTSSVMPVAPDVLTLGGETNIDYTVVTSTTASPFWDVTGDTLDFTVWQARNVDGAETLDVVYIFLGWNDISVSLTTYMAQVRTFLNKLHSDIDGCIVRIIGIQVPSPTGGGGYQYDTDRFPLSQYYSSLVAANDMNVAYQSLANETDYSSWVEFVGMMPQFDAEYNYPSTSIDVNTRNSTTQELIGSNGVHPNGDGQNQIADAVYREFVATFLG